MVYYAYKFLEDKNLEELADVMDVLFGLADSLGYGEEELLMARDKHIKRLYQKEIHIIENSMKF